MWWIIAVAIFLIIGYFIYSRKTTSVRLSKNQLELMQGLISKELDGMEAERQKIIDQGAKEGKSIPLAPLLSVLDKLKAEQPDNIAFSTEIERQKTELVEKYGTHMPVDVAYKLMKEYEAEQN